MMEANAGVDGVSLTKALVGWLLPPGLLVLLLLLFAFWARRKGQRRLSLAALAMAALTYLWSIPAVADAWVRHVEAYASPPARIDGDVLVMLGAGATPDTPDVDGAGMLSGDGESRLLTTYRLYRLTKLPIVLSGGQVFPDDGVEAEIARRQLLSLGVPATAVFVEDQSRTTEENAKYTSRLLALHHWRHPVLVTSAFHMRRAVLDFQQYGVHVQPYPCDYLVSRRPAWYANQFVPSAAALSLTWTALHEQLGTLEAWLRDTHVHGDAVPTQ